MPHEVAFWLVDAGGAKCPMCNSDVTVAILEKAIEEESSGKK